MAETIENLMLEHLKRFQTTQDQILRELQLVTQRLGNLEAAVARLGRDQSGTYEEQILDRHATDKLRERVDRIERRLELI